MPIQQPLVERVEILDIGLPGQRGLPGVIGPKGITITAPTDSENIALFRAPEDLTIAQIDAIVAGSGSPSITFSVLFGPDRLTPTEVVVGGIIVNSTDTGLSTSVLDNALVPQNSWVWITTSSKSGTVTELHVSLIFQ